MHPCGGIFQPACHRRLVSVLLQAEEADFTADLHGNWTLENAKSRLHQFLQTHHIKAEYKYTVVGPDHGRFDVTGCLLH